MPSCASHCKTVPSGVALSGPVTGSEFSSSALGELLASRSWLGVEGVLPPSGDCGAAAYSGFVEDLCEVLANSSFRDAEASCNLSVGPPSGDQAQHLGFSPGGLELLAKRRCDHGACGSLLLAKPLAGQSQR